MTSPCPRLRPPGALQRRRMGRPRAARRRLPHLRPPGLGRADLQPHLAARAGRPEPHFLINPFGLHYSEVRASNLVKVDVNGNIIGHSDWPINPAGFTFHGAIHEHVPDAHCVMHVHTTPTMAVCCLDEGLSFTNFYAAQLFGKVAYHEFEGITVHRDEGARILDSAGGKPVLLLRNHGPVMIGQHAGAGLQPDVAGQRACEVQLASQGMGKPRADRAAGARELRARLAELQPEVRRRRRRLRRAAAPGRREGPGLPALNRPVGASGFRSPACLTTRNGSINLEK